MSVQHPSIGRVVHYHTGGRDGRGDPIYAPATIVKVNADTVNLHVMLDADDPDTGIALVRHVTRVVEGDGLYQWRWPPRV